ncbi:MAG: hypothetical protein DHS20C11_08660 [Lysobacteraceae bacterium]|nr:MAG: hypothetical protein DHS20C11_08660 [Xanthomonadaceae bacterium]
MTTVRTLVCLVLLAAFGQARAQVYTPAVTASGTDSAVFDHHYTDISGQTRLIAFVIRYPDVAGPQPVVLLSHGGGNGLCSPIGALREWRFRTTQAGYVSVSVAHAPHYDYDSSTGLPGCPGQADPASVDLMCQALNVDNTPNPDERNECERVGIINWDRTQDLTEVIGQLQQLASSAPWDTRLDMDRLAVAGHSGGAAGAISLGGAIRAFGRDDMGDVNYPDLSHPLVDAQVLLSPAGSGRLGFYDTGFDQSNQSWQAINIPTLMLTGDGDNTCSPRGNCIGGDSPTTRKVAFELLPPTTQGYLLDVVDSATSHSLFGGNIQSCYDDPGVVPAHCDVMTDWLTGSIHAFLDAWLRDHQPAMVFLNQGLITGLTGGVAQWTAPDLIFIAGFQ